MRLKQVLGLVIILSIMGCSESALPVSENAADSSIELVGKTEVAMGDDQLEESIAAESASSESTTEAAEPTELRVGDVAPRLQLADWVRGSQIDDFESGRIYVVEFWATWCGPCRAGMPHISDLQDKLAGDVTFIGVTREDRETVETFLGRDQSDEATWDDVIRYTIATDDDDATGRNYMQAAGQTGIPCAFVVGRDGHVEWIGHPGGIDKPLQAIIDGDWDRAGFAASRAAEREAMPKIRSAIRSEDWDAALETLSVLRERMPEDVQFALMQANVLMRAERASEANVLFEEIARADWDDPSLLNSISWTMATDFPADSRNLPLALEIADRANELTNGKDASVLDTVARIQYELGNLDKAIELQTEAVELDDSVQEALDKYLAERDQATAPADSDEASDAEGGEEAAVSEDSETANADPASDEPSSSDGGSEGDSN